MEETKTPADIQDTKAENGKAGFTFYHKMMEEVQDYAIILLNKEGIITDWNLGAEKIKGYKETEIIGKSFRIFYQKEDQDNKLPEKLIEEATSQGRAMHEGWRIRKDGTKFWGSITITALHDNGQIIGFVKVTRDLTERKLAEDRMRQYATDLEIRNRELEQFAYVASHDLQEPMRKIQTFIQLIDKSTTDPETKNKYLDKINLAAQRMASLIKAILNYSRLSNFDEKFVDIDLNEVLELVKTDLELLLKEKSADIKSDKLPVIKGISLQINQLFSNLIGNSLKFSSGSAVIQISSHLLSSREMSVICGLHQNRAFCELIFEDNGIGFDPQYVDQIFTMFRRLHSNQDYPGTGIGLALCKKIAENHHGFIRASGEPGKGASFRVYLPLNE